VHRVEQDHRIASTRHRQNHRPPRATGRHDEPAHRGVDGASPEARRLSSRARSGSRRSRPGWRGRGHGIVICSLEGNDSAWHYSAAPALAAAQC
jgi:hypothetical protein